MPHDASRTSAQPAALPAIKAPGVVVVGGGAAGMAAAHAAACTLAAAGAADVPVLLLEKNARVGRRLLATGNGRCNFGHEPLDARNYCSQDAAALAAFVAARPKGGAAGWLQQLGLLCRSEGEGRLYPYSGQAATVLDVLRAALAAAGVQQLCGCRVQALRAQAAGVEVCAQYIPPADGAPAAAKRAPLPLRFGPAQVVLAAGGAAAPALGGTREGYALAAMLGHGCTPLFPALVGLCCRPQAGGTLAALKGVRAQAAVTLLDGARRVAADAGEVQFNAQGVSGIPVMQLSLRLFGLAAPVLQLDLLPQLPPAQLEQMLAQRAARPATELLLGMLHKRLAEAVQRAAGLPAQGRPGAQQLHRLAQTIKGWRLTVQGTAGWAGAQVTAGGVPLAEVDPHSCASRCCHGLYLAGEMLDAAGECGGFNLDWAFTTGLRAGRAAALAAVAAREGVER